MKISPNRIVSLRYVMRNSKGDIMENNLDSSPVQYLHASGNIIPALEAAVEGLEAGQSKSISISPETHPDLNERLHFELVIDEVREATSEEIRSGKPAMKDCGPDCCC